MAFGSDILKTLREKKRLSIAKIISAIRFRINQLVREPNPSEREFMAMTVNHGQFSAKLRSLGLPAAANEIQRNAFYIGLCWIKLAQEHLEDSAACLVAGRKRATFSRAYYAAYNASKGVRYIVSGAVSLKGHDHHRASDLPNDFPSVDRWTAAIPKLYEHRLYSDYDNWRATESEYSLTPTEAHELAKEFVAVAISYLQEKHGI